MSFLTKDQLDKYLNSLSNNSSNTYKNRMSRTPTTPTTEYHKLKNELVYPLQNLAITADEKEQLQHSASNDDIENEGYGSIRDRMRRLKEATGTALSTTHNVTPAFPAMPKRVSEETIFTVTQPKNKIDAFEASLDPKAFQHRQQQFRKKQLEDEQGQSPDHQLQQEQQKTSIPLPPSLPQSSTSSSSKKGSPPITPPPLPKLSSSSSNSSLPPPAIPNSPRPPKPVNSTATEQSNSKAETLNPIYAGLDCPKCQRPIEGGGEIVSVMDDQQVWHAHCFKCTTCHAPLEHAQYYEHEGRPYCEKDYKELFSLMCDHCRKPIINQAAIRALGKHYHEGHFCCTACQKPLGDQVAFLVHEEKPYCQDDYQRLFGKRCSGCQQAISGQYINAIEQSWHPNCFVCAECKKPFENGSFLVRDNKPYCEADYYNTNSEATTRQPSQRPQRSGMQSSNNTPPPPALKPKPSIPKKPTFTSTSSSSSPPPNAAQSQTAERPVSQKTPSASLSGTGKKSTDNTTDKKRCHHCKDFIDGPSANAFNHDYHIHHFQCSVCSRALSSRVPGMWQDDGFGEIICKMCAFKKSQNQK